MLIDWFTVAAQALNFLILVWLLKRFLYQPVLDAINAREQRIALQLADAAAKEAAASKERDEFARKNTEFDAQRAALFDKASEEAKAELQRLLEQARKEADALRSRLQDALGNERAALNAKITRRTCDEVFAIARKTLADLATVSLEDSMARVFIARLGSLSAADKKALAAAIEAAAGTAVVRSAFELPAQQRSAIEQGLAATGVSAARLSYETVPGLISGVELNAGGHKLAWSIADYLSGLQQRLGEILQPAAAPAGERAPAAPAAAAAEGK
jgi:F-type H+-transporting ATPase subunit b